MKNELPNLHQEAFKYKNTKRLQHDGGRSWVKDPQLHEARKGANGRLHTIQAEKEKADIPKQDEAKRSI